MAARKSPGKLPQKQDGAPVDVIDISSDSEQEASEVDDEAPEPVPDSPAGVEEQPLLRAAGIKYKTEEPRSEEEPQQERQLSPSSSKLALRVKETGSAKHRRVSIEIPLPTSSELRRRIAEAEGALNQEHHGDEVSKTPSERKHITFDDSDYDEFVTPKEAPSRDPLENSVPRATSTTARADTAAQDGEEHEEEESDDDDAPPESISNTAAAAETLKAEQAAVKAAQQQAAALKRKRQERDAFFKQQAEERKRAQRPDRQDDEADDVAPSARGATPETEQRKREVPKLLPLELLESDDEEDVARLSRPAADGTQKRRRLDSAEQLLLREAKLPKDKRRGSTAYRVVAGTGDERLAPKVKKQAVGLRETLLRRDRVAKPRGGFFVRKR